MVSRYQAELLKRTSHLLNGRAQIVFDLPQVLGHGHQGDIVGEADNLYVASEVKAQNGVVHDVPQDGPQDRFLWYACSDSVGLWSVVRIVVKLSR
uniref:Uncharacterized protein n=1 Tax=Trichogramma kaykai TaxID=54128 RepID=A0ABD2WMJ6_9HYME